MSHLYYVLHRDRLKDGTLAITKRTKPMSFAEADKLRRKIERARGDASIVEVEHHPHP